MRPAGRLRPCSRAYRRLVRGHAAPHPPPRRLGQRHRHGSLVVLIVCCSEVHVAPKPGWGTRLRPRRPSTRQGGGAAQEPADARPGATTPAGWSGPPHRGPLASHHASPGLPEFRDVSADLQELRYVSPDLPDLQELRYVSADLPDLQELRYVSPDLRVPGSPAELRHVSPDLPELRDVSPDLPDLPELRHVSPDLPELRDVSPDLPDLPELRHVSPDLPGLPELRDVSPDLRSYVTCPRISGVASRVPGSPGPPGVT
jgi:hypothetical protein